MKSSYSLPQDQAAIWHETWDGQTLVFYCKVAKKALKPWHTWQLGAFFFKGVIQECGSAKPAISWGLFGSEHWWEPSWKLSKKKLASLSAASLVLLGCIPNYYVMYVNMTWTFAKWIHPRTLLFIIFMDTSVVNRSPPFLARRHFVTLAASSGARCEVRNMARGLSSAERGGTANLKTQ